MAALLLALLTLGSCLPADTVIRLSAHRRLPTPAMCRAIRLEAGLTQQEVARALGVLRVTVARWECGTRSPKGEFLIRYLKLLDELRALKAEESR